MAKKKSASEMSLIYFKKRFEDLDAVLDTLSDTYSDARAALADHLDELEVERELKT